MTSLADWYADRTERTGIVAEGLRIAAVKVRPDDTKDAERVGLPAPVEWESWLRELFPSSVRYGFAARHRDLWGWVWKIELGMYYRSFVAIWSRGGAKSTSAELATVALGVRGKRRYCLYVRATQQDADNSVSNIATLLESNSIDRHYPSHAERAVGKFGSSKGWRRNRLRTAGGFTVDAIGLDVAVRGVKMDDQRPDVIVLDDIDGKHDSKETTQKKIDIITTSILPAGSDDCVVLAIQNLIIPNGVFSQLADNRADFLSDRIVSGPHPAMHDLKTKNVFDKELGRVIARITGGTPTWEGQDVAACQRLMNKIGLRAFEQECQHNVKKREGALWDRDTIQRVHEAPRMKRIVVAVDPSGGGDEIGIIAAGLGHDGRAYILRDVTQKGSLGPKNWGNWTVDTYDELKADKIIGEKNFGGNLVESNILASAIDDNGKQRRLPVKLVNASRGKDVRAEPVATLYGEGLVVHVGTFEELETEMAFWVPGDPDSPNRLDAMVWALTELMLQEQGRDRPRFSTVSAA